MSDIKVTMGGKLDPSYSAMFSSAKSYADNFSGSLVSGMIQGFSAVQIASKAIGVLHEKFSEAIHSAKQFTNVANQLGLKPEQVASFGAIGKEIGVSTTVLVKLFQKLKMSSASALSKPNSDMAEAFKQIGISVEELRNGLASEDGLNSLMGKVADKLNSIGDEGQQLEATNALLGVLGTRAKNFLDLGSAGIAEMSAKQATMSAQSIEISKRVGDMMDKSGKIISTIFNEAVMPVMFAFFATINTIIDGLKMLWDTLVSVGETIMLVFNPVDTFSKVIDRWIKKIDKAKKDLEEVWNGKDAPPEGGQEGVFTTQAQRDALKKSSDDIDKSRRDRKFESGTDYEKIDILKEERDLIHKKMKDNTMAMQDAIDRQTHYNELKKQEEEITSQIDTLRSNIAETEEKEAKAQADKNKSGLRKLMEAGLGFGGKDEDKLAQNKLKTTNTQKDLTHAIDIGAEYDVIAGFQLELINLAKERQDIEKKISDTKKKADKDASKEEYARIADAKKLADLKANNEKKKGDIAEEVLERQMKKEGKSDQEIARHKLDHALVNLHQLQSAKNVYDSEYAGRTKDLEDEIKFNQQYGDKEVAEQRIKDLQEYKEQGVQQESDILDAQKAVNDISDEASKASDPLNKGGQTFSSHLRSIGGGGGYFSTQGKDKQLQVAQKSEQHLQAIKDALNGGKGEVIGKDIGGGDLYNSPSMFSKPNWNPNAGHAGGLLNDNNY